MNIITLSNIYKCRPSVIMDLNDEYTSYCFDEACAYILIKVEDGEEPRFRKRVTSFRDIYKQYR